MDPPCANVFDQVATSTQFFQKPQSLVYILFSLLLFDEFPGSSIYVRTTDIPAVILVVGRELASIGWITAPFACDIPFDILYNCHFNLFKLNLDIIVLALITIDSLLAHLSELSKIIKHFITEIVLQYLTTF